MGTYRGVSGVHAPLLHVRRHTHQHYLATRALEPALELVRTVDIHATDFEHGVVRPVDWLVYLYYAGLVYAVHGAHTAALALWDTVGAWTHQCIASPAETASWVQVDAFQKGILVRLLRGDTPHADVLLHATSAGVRSQYLRHSAAYIAFADAYARGRAGARDVHGCRDENRTQFTHDQSLGLVDECIAQQPQRWLEVLAAIFRTLPLAAVAAYLGSSLEDARSQCEHAACVATITDAPIDAGAVALPDHVPCTLARGVVPYVHFSPASTAAPPRSDEHAARSALRTLLHDSLLAPEHLAKLLSAAPNAAQTP